MHALHNNLAPLVVPRSRLSLPGAQNAELRSEFIPVHIVDKPSVLEINCASFAEHLQINRENNLVDKVKTNQWCWAENILFRALLEGAFDCYEANRNHPNSVICGECKFFDRIKIPPFADSRYRKWNLFVMLIDSWSNDIPLPAIPKPPNCITNPETCRARCPVDRVGVRIQGNAYNEIAHKP
jgi:hypothetical protein